MIRMICISCKKEVDDDLVFCTECGERLFEPTIDGRTLLRPEFEPAPGSGGSQPDARRNLFVGGILILSLLAVGAGILFNPFSTRNGKPDNQSKTRSGSNRSMPDQNRIKDISSNTTISNADGNSNKPKLLPNLENPTESVLNEKFTVDPNSHIVFSFTVSAETAKLIGTAELLEGQRFVGYVFLHDVFDQRSVDPTYKMFSFDAEHVKIAQIEQTLVKGEYVLVFTNSDDIPITLKIRISQTPQLVGKEF